MAKRKAAKPSPVSGSFSAAAFGGLPENDGWGKPALPPGLAATGREFAARVSGAEPIVGPTPAEPTVSPPVADVANADATAPLPHRCNLLLQAMLELNATTEPARQTRDAIYEQAEGKNANGDHRAAFTRLRDDGLIDVARGPNGGCWLTESGHTLAEQLRDGDKQPPRS